MNATYNKLVIATCLLAFMVVGLGAYTRLGNAGLGCPDWPGCYGELTVPETEMQVEEKHYLEARPLEPVKAWKEMIHRYFAGTLGLLILAIGIWSWKLRENNNQPIKLPVFLIALVIFQAALGMWTVTLQLKPVIVMGHLLGGFFTFGLLFLLYLRTSLAARLSSEWVSNGKLFGAIGLVLVLLQISLGGWTSSNYAALACADFPMCQGAWIPETDFKEGFVLWRGLGINYEFGVLDGPARTAIHFAHRVGALITFLYVGWMAGKLMAKGSGSYKKAGVSILVLLVLQVLLGIGNVVMSLPISVAVAHNMVAALLFLSLINVNYLLWRRQY